VNVDNLKQTHWNTGDVPRQWETENSANYRPF